MKILTERLADSFAGSGKVVLVSGPVGVGKTALLNAFVERAAESGAQVLSATCSPAESQLPWGVVGQLFHTVLPPGETTKLPDLADRESTLSRLGDPALKAIEATVARAMQGLCLRLLELAESVPLVICVDDVQHADSPSLHGLLCLVRRLQSARVLVVFSEAAPPRPAYTPLHAELLHHPSCRHLRLPLLTGSGVRDLVTGHSERAAAALQSALAVSGGNPRLLVALLEDRSRTAAGPPDEVVVSDSYCRALLTCVHHCGPAAFVVACGLAVLGEFAEENGLARLARLDVEEVTRAIQAMSAAGLLHEGRFRDPAAVTALLDELPRAHRSELHLRAACLLNQRGCAPAAVARILLAVDSPREAWMSPVLVEAAELALHTDETGFALECLELAGRTTTDRRARIAITAKKARTEWKVNPAMAARHLGPLLDAMRDGLLDRADGIGMIRQLLWHGRFEEAVEVLDWLRDPISRCTTEVADDLRDIELWISCCYPPLARRNNARVGAATESRNLAGLRADPGMRAASALAGVLSGDQSDAVVVRAEQILGHGPLRHEALWDDEPTTFALLMLIYADRAAQARPWCDRLFAEAAQRGIPTWQAMIAGLRAEVAIRLGDLVSADADARRALEHVPAKGWGVGIGLPLGCLILATTRMGRLDEAAALLEQPVPDAMYRSRLCLHYLYARGQYSLAVGNHHAALADFLSCGELMREWGLDVAGLVPWRLGAAEAWLAQGNSDQARRLVNNQLARLGSDHSRVRGVSLRVLAAVTTDVKRRPPLLLEAAEILERREDQFELSRSLVDLGHAYDALGDAPRARMVTRHGRRLAKHCAAASFVPSPAPDGQEPARRRHRLTAGRTGALTDAERRVAALAAVGHTNRQIGRKLFITASTVEQHLTRVYRKLNVKDRTDLAEVLDETLVAGRV